MKNETAAKAYMLLMQGGRTDAGDWLDLKKRYPCSTPTTEWIIAVPPEEGIVAPTQIMPPKSNIHCGSRLKRTL